MFAPPPQIFHKLLFSHVVGKVQSPQEHFKTITYAKLGTEGLGGGGGGANRVYYGGFENGE